MTEIRGEVDVRIVPVQLAKDKGNSGTQGQGSAEQAAEHDPIWRKGIGREGGRKEGRKEKERLVASHAWAA